MDQLDEEKKHWNGKISQKLHKHHWLPRCWLRKKSRACSLFIRPKLRLRAEKTVKSATAEAETLEDEAAVEETAGAICSLNMERLCSVWATKSSTALSEMACESLSSIRWSCSGNWKYYCLSCSSATSPLNWALSKTSVDMSCTVGIESLKASSIADRSNPPR